MLGNNEMRIKEAAVNRDMMHMLRCMYGVPRKDNSSNEHKKGNLDRLQHGIN